MLEAQFEEPEVAAVNSAVLGHVVGWSQTVVLSGWLWLSAPVMAGSAMAEALWIRVLGGRVSIPQSHRIAHHACFAETGVIGEAPSLPVWALSIELWRRRRRWRCLVVANAGVCEVSFVVHRWCSRDGQVSEARSESTFSACLTLIRAVIQLRCFHLGCGLLSCVVCGVS
eukprot:COSAG02_NODE_715_length_18086_cov_109.753433_8_plen_170_part_00